MGRSGDSQPVAAASPAPTGSCDNPSHVPEPDHELAGVPGWPALPHPELGGRLTVALCSRRAQAEVAPMAAAFGVDIAFVERVDLLSEWVEAYCPGVIIVDTDLLGLPADLCRMARSLRSDVFTIALTNHWSEREERLMGVVDAVLHKPPRREEWHRLFG